VKHNIGIVVPSDFSARGKLTIWMKVYEIPAESTPVDLQPLTERLNS
jgi:hypothetical protein